MNRIIETKLRQFQQLMEIPQGTRKVRKGSWKSNLLLIKEERCHKLGFSARSSGFLYPSLPRPSGKGHACNGELIWRFGWGIRVVLTLPVALLSQTWVLLLSRGSFCKDNQLNHTEISDFRFLSYLLETPLSGLRIVNITRYIHLQVGSYQNTYARSVRIAFRLWTSSHGNKIHHSHHDFIAIHG